MHPDAFVLLARLHLLTDGATTTTPELRAAVALLTGAAFPDRAERLRPRAGEPPVLLTRLAVVALRRVGPQTVAAATAVLDGRPLATATAGGPPVAGRDLCAATG